MDAGEPLTTIEISAGAWPADGEPRPAQPMLIGISGKRDLRGAEAAVRAALDAVFEMIDGLWPLAAPRLLSALAAGADTVAAEAALARRWPVLAPLPFPLAVYEQDFADAPDDLTRLRGLLAHPKVSAFPLAALKRPGARAFEGVERCLHYEQVGLFIAERATLMVGVIGPEEVPDRIGGAARILDFPLIGDDPIARETRARSVELLPEGAPPAPRPVWRVLLEPERAARGEPLRLTAQKTAGAPSTPLKPGPDIDASLPAKAGRASEILEALVLRVEAAPTRQA